VVKGHLPTLAKRSKIVDEPFPVERDGIAILRVLVSVYVVKHE
jgi:hypothetical protein